MIVVSDVQLTVPDWKWITAAFSQYQGVIPGDGKIARVMEYSVRSGRYRFTVRQIPGTDFREYQLYDHQKDAPDRCDRIQTASQTVVRRMMMVFQFENRLVAG